MNIVITGPESTGKSWLSKFLSEEFNSTWRPEYLRDFYNAYNGVTEQQMEYVATRQIEQELRLINQHSKVLFFDTNIINLKVYYQFYFKKECPWFNALYQPVLYDYYLFLDTTVPWIQDKQRESPETRNKIFDLLTQEYQKLGLDFILISGNYKERKQEAKQVIQSLLPK